MRADEFLKRYRVLEDLLEERYIGKERKCKSVIVEYIGDPDSKGLGPALDMIRVIRNLLTHNANSDGSSVVEPSQEVLDKLEKIIEHVKTPHTAKDYGTPRQKVLYAHPNDRVVDVIRSMKEYGYAFLPICENDVVKRVFTKDCIFNYAVTKGVDHLSPEMLVSDLDAYTGIDQLPEGSYCFIDGDLSVIGVIDAFNKWTDNAKRLQIAFVTKNGSPDEPLMQLITPWDVLGVGKGETDGETVDADI